MIEIIEIIAIIELSHVQIMCYINQLNSFMHVECRAFNIHISTVVAELCSMKIR